jgi:hypothetical protein
MKKMKKMKKPPYDVTGRLLQVGDKVAVSVGASNFAIGVVYSIWTFNTWDSKVGVEATYTIHNRFNKTKHRVKSNLSRPAMSVLKLDNSVNIKNEDFYI